MMQNAGIRGYKGDFYAAALLVQDFSNPFLANAKILKIVKKNFFIQHNVLILACFHTVAGSDQESPVQSQWCSADCGISGGESPQHASVCSCLCCTVSQLELAGSSGSHALGLLRWNCCGHRHAELLVPGSVEAGWGCG